MLAIADCRRALTHSSPTQRKKNWKKIITYLMLVHLMVEGMLSINKIVWIPQRKQLISNKVKKHFTETWFWGTSQTRHRLQRKQRQERLHDGVIMQAKGNRNNGWTHAPSLKKCLWLPRPFALWEAPCSSNRMQSELYVALKSNKGINWQHILYSTNEPSKPVRLKSAFFVFLTKIRSSFTLSNWAILIQFRHELSM